MRHDLSNWVIHFVHRRNPENDPLDFHRDPETFEVVPFADNFNYEGQPIEQLDMYEEEEYGLEPDAYAFSVLKKILHDGFIKTGWSFRNSKPTIYGPKAATCFTEMPLYGLIDYAKKRGDEYFTEEYGIALLKNELFKFGGRPVIYGLSSPHKEADSNDPFYGIGLRTLSSKVGLGLKEQYRYVYTNLGSNKRTDWTHEREWRWADLNEKFDFPGIPLFALNDEIEFSKIIVFVKSIDERKQLIDLLKNLYHSKSTNRGREYNLKVISNTYVLSLEELSAIKKEIDLIRLDDLPLHSIPRIRKIKVSSETLERVKKIISQASEISYNASKDYSDQYPNKDKNGLNIGPCGFSHVVTWEANSEITQALIDLKYAESFGDGYYHIYGLKTYPCQVIDVAEAGMKAASEFLNQELEQSFSYISRLD